MTTLKARNRSIIKRGTTVGVNGVNLLVSSLEGPVVVFCGDEKGTLVKVPVGTTGVVVGVDKGSYRVLTNSEYLLLRVMGVRR